MNFRNTLYQYLTFQYQKYLVSYVFGKNKKMKVDKKIKIENIYYNLGKNIILR